MAPISFIYALSLGLLLLILALKWYYKRIVIPFKFLSFILLSALLLELCTSLIFDYLPNNLFFYHFYNPIEFILYSLFFSSLSIPVKTKKYIRLVIPVYLLTALYLSLFVQKINDNNSYAICLESVIIILYCLLYLRYINIYQIENRAERNPYFWITIGILLYFTGSLFLEGFLNLLIKVSVDTARLYYKIGFIFKYLMCLMFLTGLFFSNIFNKAKD